MERRTIVEIAGVPYELFIDPKIHTYVVDFGGVQWIIDRLRPYVEAKVSESTDAIVVVKYLGSRKSSGGSFINVFTNTYTLVVKKNEGEAGLFLENTEHWIGTSKLLATYYKNTVDKAGNVLICELEGKKYFVNQDAITAFVTQDPEYQEIRARTFVPPHLLELVFLIDPSIYIGDGTVHGVTGPATYRESGNEVYITITKEFFTGERWS